jgi:hypothetical protein
MVHVGVVCQLMHHHHLDGIERKPSSILGRKHQLNDLAIVEVPTNKLAVWLMLF